MGKGLLFLKTLFYLDDVGLLVLDKDTLDAGL